jgi:3-keto-5-aminohexanoate cleavage enzyme
MSRLATLPPVMVAPNGARLTHADHPAIPVTIAETVAVAAACYAAGAGAIHAHVRGPDGVHVLDAGLYAELLAELARAVPDMAVQITTESQGRYGPAEMRAVMDDLQPDGISVAVREMLADGEEVAARDFYRQMADRDITVQHILFDTTDAVRLCQLIRLGFLPPAAPQVLFVLGRYAVPEGVPPQTIPAFLDTLARGGVARADWSVCAFGVRETDALAEAFRLRGKARVGFENSLLRADGSVARDNAERVADIVALRRTTTAF